MDTQLQLPIRNAGLFSALRRYVQDAFELFRQDRAEGADVSFSVEDHSKLDDRKPFYEYRPLTERFVTDRLERVWQLSASDDAAWAIASDPACSAYLRAGRADASVDLEQVARTEVLTPLLLAMAEADPAFELDEAQLLSHYSRFESTLYATSRRYVAIAPLWGVRLVSGDIEIATGVTIRAVDRDWFKLEWPEAAQLDWGIESNDGLPQVVLQLERQVDSDDGEHVIDPLRAITEVTTVVRALAGGSVAAGPLVLERFDWRPLAPKPVPAIAARRCGHLPSRIDTTIAAYLPRALRRISSDPDGALARAAERYQIAATGQGMAALRAVYENLIEIYASEREVSSAALRMAVVLGVNTPERRAFVDAMNSAEAYIKQRQDPDANAVRVTRTLTAALRATIAAGLVGELPITKLAEYADAVIIGERERVQLGIAAMSPDLLS